MTDAQRIADLERKVAALAGEVQDLRAKAFRLRTVEEIRADAYRQESSGPPCRPRHLRVVGGDR